jgi:hypothetical protein
MAGVLSAYPNYGGANAPLISHRSGWFTVDACIRRATGQIWIGKLVLQCIFGKQIVQAEY